jgi:hypothetical protein
VGDPALRVLGNVAVALSALVEARTQEGARVLDAVLLPVIDERVPLEWAGDVYRTVLGPAARLVDAAHVDAWHRSLREWCDSRVIAVDVVLGTR